MRGAADISPEVLAHGDRGFFEDLEQLLLNLFLFGVRVGFGHAWICMDVAEDVSRRLDS